MWIWNSRDVRSVFFSFSCSKGGTIIGPIPKLRHVLSINTISTPLSHKEKCGMSLGRPRERTDERRRSSSAQPRTSEGCRSHGRHGCDIYKYYGYRMKGARMNKQSAAKMVCPFPLSAPGNLNYVIPYRAIGEIYLMSDGCN